LLEYEASGVELGFSQSKQHSVMIPLSPEQFLIHFTVFWDYLFGFQNPKAFQLPIISKFWDIRINI